MDKKKLQEEYVRGFHEGERNLRVASHEYNEVVSYLLMGYKTGHWKKISMRNKAIKLAIEVMDHPIGMVALAEYLRFELKKYSEFLDKVKK